MKVSDKDVKDFIDSRKVLTKVELFKFIYPKSKLNWHGGCRLERWWDYVLKTKKWKELREYRDNKISIGSSRGIYEPFMNIYNSDPRAKGAGKRTMLKLCHLHGLNISLSTIQRYLREIRQDRTRKV